MMYSLTWNVSKTEIGKTMSQLFYCLESSSSILFTFVDINIIKVLSKIKFQLSQEFNVNLKESWLSLKHLVRMESALWYKST